MMKQLCKNSLVIAYKNRLPFIIWLKNSTARELPERNEHMSTKVLYTDSQKGSIQRSQSLEANLLSASTESTNKL